MINRPKKRVPRKPKCQIPRGTKVLAENVSQCTEQLSTGKVQKGIPISGFLWDQIIHRSIAAKCGAIRRILWQKLAGWLLGRCNLVTARLQKKRWEAIIEYCHLHIVPSLAARHSCKGFITSCRSWRRQHSTRCK